ncbi:class I SAM-dependent methyltransferase [Streptomyces antnestii]|uniref:Class I SAM-dependent methyltransferase n=1 Tax=Streptomyces antnestii TaxID=2494256 RepID=A0A437PLX5_9ACTN|nr:class I SAM-dependent methyltransferase [Streptomyces sp. San01]
MQLGSVQETLLIPLYGRAVDARRKDSVLGDTRAAELVASLDYDFTRFDDLPSLTGAVLRTALFDHWVSGFLTAHPAGTLVELGAGLNTRYERLDNGTAHWFDLDLPDVTALRRTFVPDTPRRTAIAASVTEAAWPDIVTARSAGPYFLAAEAVLPFLDEAGARHAIGLLSDRFPGALLALDTAGPAFIAGQDHHDALSKVDARMRWACAGPDQLAQWFPGIDVLASHTLSTPPTKMYEELPVAHRQLLDGLAAQQLPQVEEYRLNLVRLP